MYKPPSRPTHDITQPYNSGIVKIYSVADAALPGYAPQPKLTEKVSLRYEEMRLGINRYYAAKQNNIEIDRVIRCPRWGKVTNQDVAITEDGEQYAIEQVQTVDNVYPASVDLTLRKIVQQYEVAADGMV